MLVLALYFISTVPWVAYLVLRYCPVEYREQTIKIVFSLECLIQAFYLVYMIRTLARQDLERFKIPDRADSPMIAEAAPVVQPLPIPLPPKQRKPRQTRDTYISTPGSQHYARPGSISGQEVVPPRCRTIQHVQHGVYTGRSLHGSSTHLALPYNSDYSHLHTARNSPGPSYHGSPSNSTSRDQPPEYQALAPVQDREVRNYPSTELRDQAVRNHLSTEVGPYVTPLEVIPRNYPEVRPEHPPRTYPTTDVQRYPVNEVRDQSPRSAAPILSDRSRSGSLRNVNYPSTESRDQSPRTINSNLSEPIHLSNRSINYPEGPRTVAQSEHSGSLRSVNYPGTELRNMESPRAAESSSPRNVTYLSTEPKVSPV